MGSGKTSHATRLIPCDASLSTEIFLEYQGADWFVFKVSNVN